MTFITHPKHGADNVSPSEVADREKIGWKVTDRADWMAAKGKPPADEAPQALGPVAPVATKKKPGRQPKVR